MSFARWKNLEACRLEQMQIGHVEKDADTICLSIKERADKGLLYKAAPTLEILKSKDGELIVAGPASWECEDYEHDIVTTEAQVDFLTKFFQLPPEYRNVSIDHSNFQIGVAIPRWPEDDPKYFSHVHEKGMYLITKVRSDNLAHSQHYRQLIRDGIYKMYSISGKPLRCDGPCDRAMRTEKLRKLFGIDPIEVAMVKEGMNQKAGPLQTLSKQQPQHPTEKDRLINHYGEEKALQLLSLIGDDAYKLLPPRQQQHHVEKRDLQKPFADYESWEACMADCHANHPDVSDCEAWCGRIKHETEDKRKPRTFEQHDAEVRHAVAKGQSLTFQQETEAIFRKHFPEYHGD